MTGTGNRANTAVTTDDLARFVELLAARLASEKDHLTELDAAIGDADHGINMDRGFAAVVAKLP
jgi:dihydroxyacetone kinase-like protein